MHKKNMTILAVDDTESNIDILVGLLAEQYDLLVALDGITALSIVEEEENIDLILLDIMMPNMDGYEVCKKLKNNPKTKDIPIIFITAKMDEDSIEEAYDVGGIDYVTKPFKPRELQARVKTHLKLKSFIDHLEYISSHDTMTGIYNRRKFFELASNTFENSKNLCAAMLDIDYFKHINDSYGHAVGDEVIKAMVKMISNNLCDDYIFARLGGEEFVLLCEKKDTFFIQDIQTIWNDHTNFDVQTAAGMISYTISGGIAIKDETTTNIDMLLKKADFSLYEAKNSGRNKVIVSTSKELT